MRSIQRSRLPPNMSFLPSLKKGRVSISCPDCQNDLTYRSRTKGIVEFLLVFLRIRPYRCEQCDYRIFRRSLQHKPKATRLPKTTSARDHQLLAPQEAPNGGHAPHADMD